MTFVYTMVFWINPQITSSTWKWDYTKPRIFATTNETICGKEAIEAINQTEENTCKLYIMKRINTQTIQTNQKTAKNSTLISK